MDLLESGMSLAAVALAVGVARQTIHKWKAWVRDGGKKALKAVPQHVNTCRLTIQQQKQLRRIIKKEKHLLRSHFNWAKLPLG
jgi:transposase-like protein